MFQSTFPVAQAAASALQLKVQVMDNAATAPESLEYFDFALLDSGEFKEDSVREELVLPILKGLGYSLSGPNRIIRSRGLEHPFLTVGSKRRPITLIPDYLLSVGQNFAFVLDAKGPDGEIKTGQNVEQVYSYAIHPEIRVEFFALCNGREFILFDVRQNEPLLYFHIRELGLHWTRLCGYLAPAKATSTLPTRLRTLPPRRRRNLTICP